jgi:hypothetical protein
MSGLLATGALLSATLFTTWALYITLVEHPARLDSGAGPGRAQLQASYRRAAPWQVSFALAALVCGAGAAIATGRWTWLAGAVVIGSVVPFTLVAIMPTNRRLLAPAPLVEDEARRLMERWGRLHAVRTALGAIGLLLFLLTLGPR